MINNVKTWRRLGGTVLALSVAIAAALVGGASTGRAATAFTINLTPLIGTSVTNEIQQVTYGGQIGYHLHVQNTGDSTTPQVQIRVTSDLATFLDTDNPNCTGNANQMICTPPGGTLTPGDTFDANVRFTAPGSGTQVSTTAAIVVAAQSVGGKKNNGTTLQSSDPVLTNLVAGGDKQDTFLRANENAATGQLNSTHPQNFGVQLPGSLLGAPFGVGLSIHDQVGAPICGTCLASFTTLTIPAASLVSTPGNPFYNGTSNPYGWTMSAKYPPGFQLTGVFHVEDGSTTADAVPNCASIGGAPTAAEPLCWVTLTQNKGTKTVFASGLGIENGNATFG